MPFYEPCVMLTKLSKLSIINCDQKLLQVWRGIVDRLLNSILSKYWKIYKIIVALITSPILSATKFTVTEQFNKPTKKISRESKAKE